MKILIAIPSKNRVETFRKYAYQWLLHTSYDWKLFVEPQDVVEYSHSFGFEKIKDIGSNNRGLGFSKRFIQSYAKAAGYDLVFKLDDDNNGWTSFRKKNTPEESAKVFSHFMDTLIDVFTKHEDVKAIGFPYDFHMFEQVKFMPAKKVQSSYLVRTEFLTGEDEFSTFEDFSVGLNILTKGGKLFKYGMSGQQVGVAVGKGTGGCNDFDRAEQALREADQLRKMYPPLTFLKVAKPWKIEPNMRSIKL